MRHPSRLPVPLFVSVALLFAFFHGLASWLGSDRGQYGLLVAVAVVTATAMVERAIFATSLRDVLPAIGFERPDSRGMFASALAAGALIATIPIYSRLAEEPFEMYPGWPWLAAGIFAQAGVAEETLFRGYLYRHMREGRTFGRAATLSMIPFALVHLYLFATMPVAIAGASLALAVSISFPMAWLFDVGGRTIWAPALLHAVVQGAVKLAVSTNPASAFPLIWLVACMTIPFVVFTLPAGSHRGVRS